MCFQDLYTLASLLVLSSFLFSASYSVITTGIILKVCLVSLSIFPCTFLCFLILFCSLVRLFYYLFQLKKNWFPPAEASLKRCQIKKLLYDILIQSQVVKNTDNEEIGTKLYDEMFNSTKKTHGNCSSSDAHEIRITSPGASPPHVWCSRESGRVADTNCLPLTSNNMRSVMSPIQVIPCFPTSDFQIFFGFWHCACLKQ